MQDPILPMNAGIHAEFAEFLERREWTQAYSLLDEGLRVEKALQLRFVQAYGPKMPDDVYWKLLGDAYKRAFQGLETLSTGELRTLFTSRTGVERVMSGEERRILATLCDTITVYRGYHDPARLERFSWTYHE